MKITIRNNGYETIADLVDISEFKKEFSPIDIKNTIFNDVKEDIKKLPSGELTLDKLISLLTLYREKYGNMPVLNFHGKEGTFTRPTINDIDVVKKYFTISGNTRDVFMNVHHEKALSLFTA